MLAASLERHMGGVQTHEVAKLRAIIFSCHNARYYENSIEPKLERYHVETVRKIDPNKSNVVDLSDCDVVILLLELMPSHHVSQIRAQAKKQGKELISLHRQVSDWERAFARKEDQRIAGAVKPISAKFEAEPRIPPKVTPPPAPSHSLPPSVTKGPVPMWGKEDTSKSLPILPANIVEEPLETEAISPEYAEWLSLLEADNTKQAAEIRDLKTAAAKQATEYQVVVDKNVQLDRKNKELMDRIRTAETREANQRHELANIQQGHRQEINELKDLLAKAQRGTEIADKNVVSDIEKALEPFKQLWKLGMMDAEEILAKLFKTKK